MPLQTYLTLDFKPNSTAANDLLERAQHEAAHDRINLTGDGDAGAASANLTPEMSSWLGAHVLPTRHSAINALRTRASQIRLGGGTEGIVESIEEDELKRARASNRLREQQAFFLDQGDNLQKLAVLEQEHAAMRSDEGNRDAKVPTKWIDFAVPVLIMIPESFLNFDSFLRLWKVPAGALGLTIVIGAAIGVSSYMTGRFLKGWSHYMRAYDAPQRAKGLRFISIALVLLVIALTAVGYARYRTVMDMVQSALVLGLAPPNLIVQTMSLLLGNLLVFGIGVAATYLLHDENPDYAERTVSLNKLKRSVEARRGATLNRKLGQIERDYTEKLKAMTRRARLMEAQPDYGPIMEDMGKIESHDKQVVALLQAYRTKLAGQLAARNKDFAFGSAMDGQVGLAAFTAAPISLYRC